MELVEFLRIRKSLLWHVGILAALVLLTFVLGQTGDVKVESDGTTSRIGSGMTLPLSALASIAMFYGAIFASSAGTSLNRENATRELSWTKPLSRTIIALRYVLIDAAAVVLVFALTLLAIAVVLAYHHVTPAIDPGIGTAFALGLGVSLMWYALVQALTFALPPGGRAIGGIMWPVALLCAGLAQVGGPTGVIARAIDVINPLAYMSGVTFASNGAHTNTVFQGPMELRAVMVWAFSIAFCAIAVALWPRQEA
jgi:hypothetical protein